MVQRTALSLDSIVASFDFDETITAENTLNPLFRKITKQDHRRKYLRSIFMGFLYALKESPGIGPEAKKRLELISENFENTSSQFRKEGLYLYMELLKRPFKKYMWTQMVQGLTDKELFKIGFELGQSESIKLNEHIVERLKLHREHGHRVLISTASPAEYVKGLLRGLSIPFNDVDGTEFSTYTDGKLTGLVLGKEKEYLDKEISVRELYKIEGREGLQDYDAKTRLPDGSYTYGNLPQDFFMLRLGDNRYHVEKNSGNVYKYSPEDKDWYPVNLELETIH